MKRTLCIAFILLLSNLFSQDMGYRIFGRDDVDKTLLVNNQKKLYERMFSDSLISWDGDGLYVFADYQKMRKLFIFEKKGHFRVFSMPKMKISPWLNTEKYYDEQEQILSKKWDSICYSEIALDSNIFSSIIRTQFWNLPYVMVYEHYKSLPLIQRPSFTGFYKEDSNETLFYIKDFRSNLSLKKPLDVYDEILDYLEKKPFIVPMENCK